MSVVSPLLALAAACATAPSPRAGYIDQGRDWRDSVRLKWYDRYQGSQLIPYRWFLALEYDGLPFAQVLTRYGYLSHPGGSSLPIGFTVSPLTSQDTVSQLGMTCAACHTREIRVDVNTYRIDGGPALVDFQAFLIDLDTAVEHALSTDAEFAEFGEKVIGSPPNPEQLETLRADVDRWHSRNHLLLDRSLSNVSWGLGRADAVQMIYNRLTGLDIGDSEHEPIPVNIEPADMPVRYPFLWNAHKEKRTQWLGFASNRGLFDPLLRNMGQAYGVFARFHPTKGYNGDVDYWEVNSLDLRGLARLETYMTKIGPPLWPGSVDQALSRQGEGIFRTECASCHDVSDQNGRWDTPIRSIGTDGRQLRLLDRPARSGILEGESFLSLGPLKYNDTALNVLKVTVAKSLLGSVERGPGPAPVNQPTSVWSAFLQPPERGYEARRLHGIWAAAPYLHNGSVPTLTELLKAPRDRVASFRLGPNYDLANVGLAADQGPNAPWMHTDANCPSASGNSRCGHEYGLRLTDQEKQALIEFLKTY